LLASIQQPHWLLPLYGLWLLLQKPPDVPGDALRMKRLATEIEPSLRPALVYLTDFYLRPFEPPIEQLFHGDADTDRIAQLFLNHFREFKRTFSRPRVIADVVLRGFVATLDVLLTNHIYLQPTKCDFLASLVWNTVSSRLAGEGLDLPLFREAVAVVQMTSVIDSDSSVIDNICPHLPANTILALLSVRELDDDLKEKPNVTAFAVAHGLNPYAEFVPTPVDTQAVFQIPPDAGTEEWAFVAVPADLLAQCPFLRNRFHS
jgi:hypothetical protein